MSIALISVTDKTGLPEFGKDLAIKLGWKILSTGGTAKILRDANVPTKEVSVYTESPEVMHGRVKTLHPRIFGGILARKDVDMRDLKILGGELIDMVVVNLYPFQKTVAKPGVTNAEAIENIDIGGPSLIRAAAKNSDRVIIITDPADYSKVIEELSLLDSVTEWTRRELMVKAFKMTAAYDMAIAKYFSGVYG